MGNNLLLEGLELMGLEFSNLQLKNIEKYIKELEMWNPSYKLVSTNGQNITINHILDSLSGLKQIKETSALFEKKTRIADLGSGAGLPGIPLAIGDIEDDFFLVERMKRRVTFLQNQILLCGISDHVKIIESDLKKVENTFDIITFRAFHKILDVLPEIDGILSKKGVIIAYKGTLEQTKLEVDEISSLYKDKFLYEIKPLKVPFLDSERCLLIISRNEE
ncbi:MAG: 16S rRNA (guanine(527)-N(7))-methyltransferase RsmG [Sphaerochaetaceae bacterium]|nr:16S rRNA (guanine(527)-N(7))-methyltransferase RsmG [Sphaerochaetaceae bacterium]